MRRGVAPARAARAVIGLAPFRQLALLQLQGHRLSPFDKPYSQPHWSIHQSCFQLPFEDAMALASGSSVSTEWSPVKGLQSRLPDGAEVSLLVAAP